MLSQKDRCNFFMVSNSIFEFRLKPRDFIVYCCLLRHQDLEKHICFPSRKLISDECCINQNTVDTAIKNLVSAGLIKKIHRYRKDGTRTSNLYYVKDLL